MTEEDFVAAVLSNPVVKAILARMPELAIDDAWLASGCLFQTAWNVITHRDPEHGIKDYDFFYFDPDTSWEAEDKIIKRAKSLFGDLDADVEIRNQARVHLWFEQKFGAPYAPLARATDGIDRFLMHNAQVGIRPCGGAFEVYAPRGFDDIAQMIVRPNYVPNFQAKNYLEKALRWKTLWPEITILPP